MDGVFLIPLAPFLFVLGIIWLQNQKKLEEKRIAAGVATRDASSPEQARQIADLQEPVRVLERIVTDGGYDVAAQIEALRDQRGMIDETAMTPRAERLERTR